MMMMMMMMMMMVLLLDPVDFRRNESLTRGTTDYSCLCELQNSKSLVLCHEFETNSQGEKQEQDVVALDGLTKVQRHILRGGG
jgi:hypothetical protein